MSRTRSADTALGRDVGDAVVGQHAVRREERPFPTRRLQRDRDAGRLSLDHEDVARQPQALELRGDPASRVVVPDGAEEAVLRDPSAARASATFPAAPAVRTAMRSMTVSPPGLGIAVTGLARTSSWTLPMTEMERLTAQASFVSSWWYRKPSTARPRRLAIDQPSSWIGRICSTARASGDGCLRQSQDGEVARGGDVGPAGDQQGGTAQRAGVLGQPDLPAVAHDRGRRSGRRGAPWARAGSCRSRGRR